MMQRKIKGKFLRQNYHKHKKLGRKWRRPKGRQSKMRKSKGGAGVLVKIGHGTPGRGLINNLQPVMVSNPDVLDCINKDKQIIIISSGLGARKAAIVAEKAKKLGIRILNTKKIKRTEKIAKTIEINRKKRETEKKKKEAAKKKEVKEKKTEEKKPAKEESKKEVKPEPKKEGVKEVEIKQRPEEKK